MIDEIGQDDDAFCKRNLVRETLFDSLLRLDAQEAREPSRAALAYDEDLHGVAET